MIEIRTNLQRLNAALRAYIRVGKKLPEEALAKQAGKLGFALSQQLRQIAPAKGSLRAEGLALLKEGRGVRVRPSVRRQVFEKQHVRFDLNRRREVFGSKGNTFVRKKGKRLNLQALAVEAELNVRERGRGFLSMASNIPRFARGLGDVQSSVSRFGPILGQAQLTAIHKGAMARFVWGPQGIASLAAATGLSIEKAQAAIGRAIDAVTEDIMVYVLEKTSRFNMT